MWEWRTPLKKLKCEPRRHKRVSTARKLCIILNYVLDFLNYALGSSDYAGMSIVSSNACIVLCLLQGYTCTLVGGFTYRTQNTSNVTEILDVNPIWNSN